MFCSKCGKEIPDGNCYCGECGNKVGEENRNFEFRGFRIDGLRKDVDALKGNMVVFWGAILTLLISVFFVGAKMLEVSYSVFWTTKYMEISLFEDKGLLEFFVSLGYIVAAAVILMPLFIKVDWKDWNFVPGMIIPALSVTIFAIVFFVTLEKMDSEELLNAVDAAVSLTTSAWLFLIVNVAAEVLVIKARRDVIGTQQYWNKYSKMETVLNIDLPADKQAAEEKIPTWKKLQMEKEAKQKEEPHNTNAE